MHRRFFTGHTLFSRKAGFACLLTLLCGSIASYATASETTSAETISAETTSAETTSHTYIATDGIIKLNFSSETMSQAGIYTTDGANAKRDEVVLVLDTADAMFQMTTDESGNIQGLSGAFSGFGEGFSILNAASDNIAIGNVFFATPNAHSTWSTLTAFRDANHTESELWFAITNSFFSPEYGELIVNFDFGLSKGNADLLGTSAKAAIGTAELTFRMRKNQTLVADEDGVVVSATLHALGDLNGPGVAGGFPTPGPDVIVGELPNMNQFGREGAAGSGTVGLAIATTSCNKGSTPLNWFQLPQTDHPIIPMNLYRLKSVNGSQRFEQIGQSWMKHAFFALQGNTCGFGCVTNPNGSRLGVGCSDPYSASLNASQCGLGARAQLNPYTGVIPAGGSVGGSPCTNYPSQDHGGHTHNNSGIEHRLQVQDVDLIAAQNPGATYYGEGQYITQHEFNDASSFANQNMHNNVSYRQFSVSGGPSSFTFPSVGSTVREQPAVNAWSGAASTMIEPAPMVDGRAFLYYEVTDLGGGTWHYEYAVYNQNLDRSISEFTVPIPTGVVLTNIDFHAPLNHSDPGVDPSEEYSNAPWSVTTSGGQISWTSETLGQNPQANAIRFGTLYNFRFDANSGPTSTNATVGFFKIAGSNQAATMGPLPVGPQDCNTNGIEDTCDIDCSAAGCNVAGCGRSADCNGNGIPDECEGLATTTLQTELIIGSGLSSPLFLTAPEGDDRLFIVEQGGTIRIRQGGSLLGTPFLNISSIVLSGGERGLLGMAFHPNYASNGLFYVNYTNNSGDTVVAEYQVSGNPNIANGTAVRTLMTIPQPFSNHNGGWIGFGPNDGYLYIATGDGGSGNDPGNRSQDITNQLLGKMLRIDVDSGTPYGIPPSNPFVGVTGDDEIWAYGLRNHWRNSFDRLTGDLWYADVGQVAREEVNYQPASSPGGENYGWRCMEGFNCTGLSGCTCNSPSLTLPIHDYPRNCTTGGFSLTGGYVYRGCDIPDLNGTYFFADYVCDNIWSFRYDGATMTEFQSRNAELIAGINSIASFGEDGFGELYIVSLSGTVHKIISAAICGNGIVEPGEECDPPDGVTCDASCQIIPTMCGDGILQPGEECDDGNLIPGDGCDEFCNVESNDDCADAALIFEGDTAFSTVGATTDGPAHPGLCDVSGDGGQTFSDIWFIHTATCTGNLSVSTCNQVNYDSDLVIYDGTNCASLNFLGCQDDTGGCAGFSSTLIAPVVGGQDYLIRIGGWASTGDQGSGTVTISNDGTNCNECTIPADCEDGNPCTDHDCVANVCIDTNNSASCDDNSLCTQTDTCSGGVCVGSNPLSCDDGNACTDDSCNAATGCVNTNNSDPCNDGNACTSGDVCSGGTCSGGSPTVCDDGNACTTDTCDMIAGCQFANNTNPCDDGDICTDGDTCSGGVCVPGSPPDCLNTTCTDCNMNGVRDDCEGLPDCNGDGIPDECQFADCNGNLINDICEIASGLEDDCDGGPVGVPADGATIFGSICFACHASDGSGGIGPNIQDHSRTVIWNMLNPPTTHTGGAQTQYDDQDIANIEAFLATGGSLGRPDSIPDSCQTLPDCDASGVADGCELEAGTLVDLDYDGIPDSCGADCFVDTDCDDNTICTYDRCSTGLCVFTAVLYGDVNHNGDVDIFDITCILDGFSIGSFAICSLEDLDIEPCPNGDGDVDVLDVTNVLDAFAGFDACGCGLPQPTAPIELLDTRLARNNASDSASISISFQEQTNKLGRGLTVDVYAGNFESLRGYQLQVVAVDESGRMIQASDIRIDSARRDFAFAGWNTFSAVDIARSRAVVAVTQGSLTWDKKSYLGTFVFDVSQAKGRVTVRLGSESIMVDGDGNTIAVKRNDGRQALAR